MKANSPAVIHALDTIFDKHATSEFDGTVKVTLEKAVNHAQFRDLAALSLYLENYPAIIRSGSGVSVVFAH